VEEPGGHQKRGSEQFGAADDGGDGFGVDRMNGENQRGSKGDVLTVGLGFKEKTEQLIKEQDDESVQEKIHKMIAERFGVSERPVQRKAGEGEGAKEMSGAGGLKQRPHGRLDDPGSVEDVGAIIERETVAEGVDVDACGHQKQEQETKACVHGAAGSDWDIGTSRPPIFARSRASRVFVTEI